MINDFGVYGFGSSNKPRNGAILVNDLRCQGEIPCCSMASRCSLVG